ncbi:MAG: T9SS type A sorting domain-containing protein [Candidatus Krumholzibacteriota bacterium]|nr:T9SS type A sorting domain-containing protein [Candidatus Krumholzibacteriota bacterium]
MTGFDGRSSSVKVSGWHRSNGNLNRSAAAVIVTCLLVISFPFSAGAVDYAFVTTTDYESGSAARILLDGSHTTATGIASIHSDAVARWYNELVYVVNRGGADNIQILDPGAGYATIGQYSTGNGSNPQDIAFRSETKAYISTFDTNELLIMNTITGEITGSIDLSSFADGDGLCEMAYIFIKHDILFVAIQRIDRNNYWGPVGDSYIAVIDCAADTLIDCDGAVPGVQSIPLTGTNPFSEIIFDEASGKLHLSCVGWFGMQDGGIEIINPYTFQSEGYLLTETAAGGDINNFDLAGGAKGYAVVTNSSFHTELVSFDRASGTKTATLYSPGAWVINDIGISPYGELFLADQTPTDPGIRVYDTATDMEITSHPIDTGLPPFDITFSVPAHSGSDIPVIAAVGQNYPNPFNPTTTIPYFCEAGSKVRLEIFDTGGRRVRVLVDSYREKGAYKALWHGRNDAGLEVASGVYFLRYTVGDITGSRKLILLR